MNKDQTIPQPDISTEPNETAEFVVEPKKTFLTTYLPFLKSAGKVLGMIIIVAGMVAGVYLAQTKQLNRSKAGGVILSFTTNNTSPKIGDTILVAASINTNGTSVAAANIVISYDPNILEASEVKQGTFLPTMLGNSTIANGKASIALGCLIDATGSYPKSGTGLLATVLFKTKTNGTTTITFDQSTGVAEIGQKNNAVSSMETLSINVNTPTDPLSPTPGTTIFPTDVASTTITTGPTPTCIPQNGSCNGPSDNRCCAPWGCDPVRKSGGLFKCGVPTD